MTSEITTTTNQKETKTAVFMMGGPGAGKSYVRKQLFPGLKVLDCDAIKAEHPDYDPKNPGPLHAWSSAELTTRFCQTIEGSESFVYDGTGTNAEKMVDWMLKAQAKGFEIVLVYVTCPMEIALQRNANRERVVPEYIVREKHEVIGTAFTLVAPFADSVKVVNNG